jgi:hypothetical protein
VIPEVLVLALASTVRPTSLAAVYAIVSHDANRRLMLVYVVAGLAFTLVFGAIIVGLTHGIHIHAGTGKTEGIADLVGGVLALAFGAGVATRRIGGARPDDAPKPGARFLAALDHRLTARTAAIAGPATHIPGLFYLIALNVIVAHSAALADKTFALVLYNAVWFAVPLAALVLCIVRPGAAPVLVGWVQQWTRDHVRGIVLVAAFGVGAVLVIRGLLAI